MGEASEVSSMSEVSTAETGKGAAGGGGSKAVILVPVILLLLVLAIVGAILITGSSADDAAKKSSEGGDPSGSSTSQSGSGGGSNDNPPPPTAQTRFAGANKVLFCFIKADDAGGYDYEFPADDVCTHVILGGNMLSQAAQNWQHDDRSYNKLVELLHKGTYKKTEAGLSVDFRKIVDTKLSDESLQTEYDKKIVHYGLHYMKSVNSLTDFKQKAVNYMKSVREFHKKVNPERTAKEALDPLYGFISMQMRPYDPSKPQETFELAQGVEDALGYPLLFIMHTNAERPFEDSAMCVLGGTPLAVPAACKMPSLTDYLKLIKTFKFKHESNTAATFDVALMSFDVQEDIKPDSKLTSLSGTTDEAGIRSRHELCEASNYPTLLPVDDVLKVEAQAKEKKVVVYDSESTWKTKLEKFNQQSTGPHLGHAVFYLEYASQDCDGEQTHPQLKKFQELSGIRRK